MPAAAIPLIVGGTAASAYGAHKAAKQQAASGREALQMQRDSQARADELLSPYSQAGGVAQNELMGMLGIGGQTSSYENPMLKQIQAQALQSITNRNAATGRGTGAGAGTAIAQSMLQPAYQMQQARIGQLQGLTSLGAQAASNQAGLNSQIANQMAGSAINVGNAQAAGTAGMYGAIGDGMGQLGGMFGYGKNKAPAVGGLGTGNAGMYQNTINTGNQWNQNTFGNGSGFGNVIGGGY